MNIKKKLVLMICFLIVSAELTAVIYAADGSVSIPVQYNVSKDSKYRTSVEVMGPGTVYDGTSKITQGTMVYELSVGEEKTFKLVPDKNSKIEKVIWNGEDITHRLAELNGVYMLSISVISIDSNLRIEFTKDNQSNNPVDGGNNNNSNSNGNNSSIDSTDKLPNDNSHNSSIDNSSKLPNTGYDANINTSILFMMIGIIVIIIGSKKIQKD